MLIKQTHFPLGSKDSNWGIIVLVAVIAIGIGFVVYQNTDEAILDNSQNQNDDPREDQIPKANT